MFDLAWSEIAVIGLVAVLVLGPKELPAAMRTMAKMMRKMRSLTSELQGHMNEIVREAELDEVRQSIQKLSSTNLKSELTKAVDPTGELQNTLNKPLLDEPLPAETAPPPPPAVLETPTGAVNAPDSNSGGLPPPSETASAAPAASAPDKPAASA